MTREMSTEKIREGISQEEGQVKMRREKIREDCCEHKINFEGFSEREGQIVIQCYINDVERTLI